MFLQSDCTYYSMKISSKDVDIFFLEMSGSRTGRTYKKREKSVRNKIFPNFKILKFKINETKIRTFCPHRIVVQYTDQLYDYFDWSLYSDPSLDSS